MKEEIDLIWDKLANWYETLVVMMPNILLALVIGVGVFFLSKGNSRVILLAWWMSIGCSGRRSCTTPYS